MAASVLADRQVLFLCCCKVSCFISVDIKSELLPDVLRSVEAE